LETNNSYENRRISYGTRKNISKNKSLSHVKSAALSTVQFWRRCYLCQFFPEVGFPQQYSVKPAVAAPAVFAVEVIKSLATAVGAIAVRLHRPGSCRSIDCFTHTALLWSDAV
jgi:hypothetical protein